MQGVCIHFRFAIIIITIMARCSSLYLKERVSLLFHVEKFLFVMNETMMLCNYDVQPGDALDGISQ
jgi:hypothetical protein